MCLPCRGRFIRVFRILNEMKSRKRKLSSFTYDLLERRPEQTDAQKERREIRRKKIERKAELEDPRRLKRIARRRRSIFLVVLIIFVIGAFLVRAGYKSYTLAKERALVKARLDALERKKAELEVELLVVNSDEYVEQQARNQLHMIKPGEILYIIPKPTSDYDATENPDYSEPVPNSPEDEQPQGEDPKP